MNSLWKEKTKNRFTVQKHRDKNASCIHDNSSKTIQTNTCYNNCYFAKTINLYRGLKPSD